MRKNNKNLLPFHIIVAATAGEREAVKAVLKHYEGYIIALATREYHDEYGFPHTYVDDVLSCRLETKLIMKTLKFKIF